MPFRTGRLARGDDRLHALLAPLISLSLFALLALLFAPASWAAPPVAKLTVMPAVTAGASRSATLLATDANGDTLTWSIISPPAQGRVTITDSHTGAFTYTANANAKTRDTFVFRVTDSEGYSDATVWVPLREKADGGTLISGALSCALGTGSWADLVDVATTAKYLPWSGQTIDLFFGVHSDGTVAVTGCQTWAIDSTVAQWTNIVAISARDGTVMGLSADGTVLSAGINYFDTTLWSGVVAASLGGSFHALGLKADGTVVAAGANGSAVDGVSAWDSVVAIAAGEHFSLGLRADGTVAVATDYSGYESIANWQGIVAIAADAWHAVGLKSDGTVVAAVDSNLHNYGQTDVGAWNNVVSVTAGPSSTLGVKADGSIVAAGVGYGFSRLDAVDWAGMALVAAGDRHVIGVGSGVIGTAAVTVNDGAAVTTAAGVTLGLTAPGATQMRFSADGSVWSLPEPFAKSKAWTLAGSGTQTVFAQFRSGMGPWSSPVSDSITLVTLTATPASPSAISNTPTVTFAAEGASVDAYQFRFQLKRGNGSWATVRDYSSNNQWSWNTAGYTPGSYQVLLQVRSSGSTAAPEAQKAVTYVLVQDPPATAVTLTPNLASPRPVGTAAVDFVASASGGSGNYEYQFLFKGADGVWVTAKSWSPVNSWTWNSAGAAAGSYAIQVKARNAGSVAPVEASKSLTYVLGDAVDLKVTLVSDPGSPVMVGNAVTFTAGASGGSGAYEFKFVLKSSTSPKTLQLDYSSASSWTWDTTHVAPGAYTATAYVRNVGSTATYEGVRNLTVELVQEPPATGLLLTPSAPSPFIKGGANSVTFTADGIGGTGNYQYQFALKGPSSTSVVQGWSATPTWIWDVTQANPGLYSVTAYVRNAGSAAAWEADRTIKYSLLGVPPVISDARVGATGTSLLVTFDKAISPSRLSPAGFRVLVDGYLRRITDAALTADATVIELKLVAPVVGGANVLLSYTPGSVSAVDTGPLAAFSNLNVTNDITSSGVAGVLYASGAGAGNALLQIERQFALTAGASLPLLRAAGYTASEVATALKSQLGKNATQNLALLLQAGYSAAEAAEPLRDLYNLDANATALLLLHANVSLSAVTQALAATYSANATVIAGALAAAKIPAVQIAQQIKSLLGADQHTTALALRAAGISLPDIGTALNQVFAADDKGVAVELRALGADASTTASIIRKLFGDDAATLAAALATGGYSAAQSSVALRALFHPDDSTLSGLLRGAGYPLAEVLGALKGLGAKVNVLSGTLTAFGVSDVAATAKLLASLGYNAATIASILAGAFHPSVAELALALQGAGADGGAIVAALHGVGATIGDVAGALRTAGFEPLATAQLLRASYSVKNAPLGAALRAGGFSVAEVTGVLFALGGDVSIAAQIAKDGGYTEAEAASALLSAGYSAARTAAGLKLIYGTSITTASALLKAGGVDASTLAQALRSAYPGASIATLSGLLQAAGYSSQEVVTALHGVNGTAGVATAAVKKQGGSDADAATQLRAAGFTAAEIAAALRTVYGDVDGQVFAQIKASGAGAADLASAMANGCGWNGYLIAAKLIEAGFSASSTAQALKLVLGATDAQTAAYLRTANLTAADAALALMSSYPEDDKSLINALVGGQYTTDAAVTSVQSLFSKNAGEIAVALYGAGVSATDAAAVLHDRFNVLSGYATAATLRAAGYDASAVGDALFAFTYVGDLSATAKVARDLNGAGFTASEVAAAFLSHIPSGVSAAAMSEPVTFLLRDAGYSTDLFAGALHDAVGFTADEVMGPLRWLSAESVVRSLEQGFGVDAVGAFALLRAHRPGRSADQPSWDAVAAGAAVRAVFGLSPADGLSALRTAGYTDAEGADVLIGVYELDITTAGLLLAPPATTLADMRAGPADTVMAGLGAYASAAQLDAFLRSWMAACPCNQGAPAASLAWERALYLLVPKLKAAGVTSTDVLPLLQLALEESGYYEGYVQLINFLHGNVALGIAYTGYSTAEVLTALHLDLGLSPVDGAVLSTLPVSEVRAAIVSELNYTAAEAASLLYAIANTNNLYLNDTLAALNAGLRDAFGEATAAARLKTLHDAGVSAANAFDFLVRRIEGIDPLAWAASPNSSDVARWFAAMTAAGYTWSETLVSGAGYANAGDGCPLGASSLYARAAKSASLDAATLAGYAASHCSAVTADVLHRQSIEEWAAAGYALSELTAALRDGFGLDGAAAHAVLLAARDAISHGAIFTLAQVNAAVEAAFGTDPIAAVVKAWVEQGASAEWTAQALSSIFLLNDAQIADRLKAVGFNVRQTLGALAAIHNTTADIRYSSISFSTLATLARQSYGSGEGQSYSLALEARQVDTPGLAVTFLHDESVSLANITQALQLRFGLDAADAFTALRAAGGVSPYYTADAIDAALRSAYTLTAAEAALAELESVTRRAGGVDPAAGAQELVATGRTAAQVAVAIKGYYGLDAAQTTTVLRALAASGSPLYDGGAVDGAVRSAYTLAVAAAADAALTSLEARTGVSDVVAGVRELNALGYSIADIAIALRSHYGLAPAEAAAVLLTVGATPAATGALYAVVDVEAAILSAWGVTTVNDSATPVVQALFVSEPSAPALLHRATLRDALAGIFGLVSAQQQAGALRMAGVSAADALDYLVQVYDGIDYSTWVATFGGAARTDLSAYQGAEGDLASWFTALQHGGYPLDETLSALSRATGHGATLVCDTSYVTMYAAVAAKAAGSSALDLAAYCTTNGALAANQMVELLAYAGYSIDEVTLALRSTLGLDDVAAYDALVAAIDYTPLLTPPIAQNPTLVPRYSSAEATASVQATFQVDPMSSAIASMVGAGASLPQVATMLVARFGLTDAQVAAEFSSRGYTTGQAMGAIAALRPDATLDQLAQVAVAAFGSVSTDALGLALAAREVSDPVAAVYTLYVYEHRTLAEITAVLRDYFALDAAGALTALRRAHAPGGGVLFPSASVSPRDLLTLVATGYSLGSWDSAGALTVALDSLTARSGVKSPLDGIKELRALGASLAGITALLRDYYGLTAVAATTALARDGFYTDAQRDGAVKIAYQLDDAGAVGVQLASLAELLGARYPGQAILQSYALGYPLDLIVARLQADYGLSAAEAFYYLTAAASGGSPIYQAGAIRTAVGSAYGLAGDALAQAELAGLQRTSVNLSLADAIRGLYNSGYSASAIATGLKASYGLSAAEVITQLMLATGSNGTLLFTAAEVHTAVTAAYGLNAAAAVVAQLTSQTARSGGRNADAAIRELSSLGYSADAIAVGLRDYYGFSAAESMAQLLLVTNGGQKLFTPLQVKAAIVASYDTSAPATIGASVASLLITRDRAALHVALAEILGIQGAAGEIAALRAGGGGAADALDYLIATFDGLDFTAWYNSYYLNSYASLAAYTEVRDRLNGWMGTMLAGGYALDDTFGAWARRTGHPSLCPSGQQPFPVVAARTAGVSAGSLLAYYASHCTIDKGTASVSVSMLAFAGYPIGEIASALQSAYGKSIAQAYDLLSTALDRSGTWTPTVSASTPPSIYTFAQMQALAQSLGLSREALRTILLDQVSAAGQGVANGILVLRADGFTLDEITAALREYYGYGAPKAIDTLNSVVETANGTTTHAYAYAAVVQAVLSAYGLVNLDEQIHAILASSSTTNTQPGPGVTALRNLGYSLAQITGALRNHYGLGTAAAISVLRSNGGYAYSDIVASVSDVYVITSVEEQIQAVLASSSTTNTQPGPGVTALRNLGYSLAQITGALKNYYGLGTAAAITVLQSNGGYAYSDIVASVSDVYAMTSADEASRAILLALRGQLGGDYPGNGILALNNAGFSLEQIAAALKGYYGLGVAGALNYLYDALGTDGNKLYTSSQVNAVVVTTYAITGVDETANILLAALRGQLGGDYPVNGILALNNAGFSLEQIAAALKGYYGLGAAGALNYLYDARGTDGNRLYTSSQVNAAVVTTFAFASDTAAIRVLLLALSDREGGDYPAHGIIELHNDGYGIDDITAALKSYYGQTADQARALLGQAVDAEGKAIFTAEAVNIAVIWSYNDLRLPYLRAGELKAGGAAPDVIFSRLVNSGATSTLNIGPMTETQAAALLLRLGYSENQAFAAAEATYHHAGWDRDGGGRLLPTCVVRMGTILKNSFGITDLDTFLQWMKNSCYDGPLPASRAAYGVRELFPDAAPGTIIRKLVANGYTISWPGDYPIIDTIGGNGDLDAAEAWGEIVLDGRPTPTLIQAFHFHFGLTVDQSFTALIDLGRPLGEIVTWVYKEYFLPRNPLVSDPNLAPRYSNWELQGIKEAMEFFVSKGLGLTPLEQMALIRDLVSLGGDAGWSRMGQIALAIRLDAVGYSLKEIFEYSLYNGASSNLLFTLLEEDPFRIRTVVADWEPGYHWWTVIDAARDAGLTFQETAEGLLLTARYGPFGQQKAFEALRNASDNYNATNYFRNLNAHIQEQYGYLHNDTPTPPAKRYLVPVPATVSPVLQAYDELGYLAQYLATGLRVYQPTFKIKSPATTTGRQRIELFVTQLNGYRDRVLSIKNNTATSYDANAYPEAIGAAANAAEAIAAVAGRYGYQLEHNEAGPLLTADTTALLTLVKAEMELIDALTTAPGVSNYVESVFPNHIVRVYDNPLGVAYSGMNDHERQVYAIKLLREQEGASARASAEILGNANTNDTNAILSFVSLFTGGISDLIAQAAGVSMFGPIEAGMMLVQAGYSVNEAWAAIMSIDSYRVQLTGMAISSISSAAYTAPVGSAMSKVMTARKCMTHANRGVSGGRTLFAARRGSQTGPAATFNGWEGGTYPAVSSTLYADDWLGYGW